MHLAVRLVANVVVIAWNYGRMHPNCVAKIAIALTSADMLRLVGIRATYAT